MTEGGGGGRRRDNGWKGRRPMGPEPNGKWESGHTNEAQPGERERVETGQGSRDGESSREETLERRARKTLRQRERERESAHRGSDREIESA